MFYFGLVIIAHCTTCCGILGNDIELCRDLHFICSFRQPFKSEERGPVQQCEVPSLTKTKMLQQKKNPKVMATILLVILPLKNCNFATLGGSAKGQGKGVAGHQWIGWKTKTGWGYSHFLTFRTTWILPLAAPV